MPIHNLTNTTPAFIRLGRIKKGDRGGKNGAPRDLDYFRVLFHQRKIDIHDEKGVRKQIDLAPLLEAKFREVYGDKPTEINVRFAATSPSAVWDANFECYRKGGLVAKAGSDENGLYWIFYRDPDTNDVLIRNREAVTSAGHAFMAKPIDLTEPIYYTADKTGAQVPHFLGYYGRLQVVIPELTKIMINGQPRAIVGFFEFAPKSAMDIRNISAELAMYDGFAKSAGRSINGIPFTLIRREETVTKNIEGTLSQAASWVCHLDCTGEWGRLALEAVEHLALPDVVDAEVSESFEDEFEDSPQPQVEPLAAEPPAPSIPSGPTTPIIIQTTTPEPMKKYMDVDKAGRMQVIRKGAKVFMNKLDDGALLYIAENHKDPETVAAADSLLHHRKQAKAAEVA